MERRWKFDRHVAIPAGFVVFNPGDVYYLG